MPAVLEIPSKDHPYDPSKDSILRRAKVTPGVKYVPLFGMMMMMGCPSVWDDGDDDGGGGGGGGKDIGSARDPKHTVWGVRVLYVGACW